MAELAGLIAVDEILAFTIVHLSLHISFVASGGALHSFQSLLLSRANYLYPSFFEFPKDTEQLSASVKSFSKRQEPLVGFCSLGPFYTIIDSIVVILISIFHLGRSLARHNNGHCAMNECI